MSKLKARTAYSIAIEEKDLESLGTTLVYLKSEADKVIALLKDKANYNEYAYKLKSEELADTCRFYEDELRHNKYKRCLAMAAKCEAWIRLDVSPRHTHRFIRWYKTWLAIAEKFKPNSTAKLGKG